MDFRKNATSYGCNEKEINYIENLLPLSNTNLIFTFEQFKSLRNYLQNYYHDNPRTLRFSLYPINNGFSVDNKIFMTLISMSSKKYQPVFGPRFINDIEKCYRKFSSSNEKLVLISECRGTLNHLFFNMFGKDEIMGSVTEGYMFNKPITNPMSDLHKLHEKNKTFTYNKQEKICTA